MSETISCTRLAASLARRDAAVRQNLWDQRSTAPYFVNPGVTPFETVMDPDTHLKTLTGGEKTIYGDYTPAQIQTRRKLEALQCRQYEDRWARRRWAREATTRVPARLRSMLRCPTTIPRVVPLTYMQGGPLAVDPAVPYLGSGALW